MSRHQQKRGENLNKQTNLFDDEVTIREEVVKLRAENAELKEKLAKLLGDYDQQLIDFSALKKDCLFKDCQMETMRHTKSYQDTIIAHLSQLLNEGDDNKGLEIRFTLSQIVCGAKELVDNKEIEGVRNLLNTMMRYIGKPDDFKQLDSLNEEIKKRNSSGNTFHADGDVVLRKETNIEHNSGLIIEHQGSLQTDLKALDKEEA